MMKNQVSSHDIELLSAYLDQQLNPREQAYLQARLEAEPDLRNTLEGIRRTRVLLRSAPRLRAPRNFTLSRQMVRARPVERAVPVLRFASAFATFLLIFALLGDYLGFLTTSAIPMSAEGPTSVEMALQVEATVEVQAKVAEEEAPLLAQELPPTITSEAEYLTQPPSAEGDMRQAPTPTTEVEVAEALPRPTQAPIESLAEQPPPDATSTAEALSTPSATATPEPSLTPTEELLQTPTLPPQPQQDLIEQSASELAETVPLAEESMPSPGLPMIRIIELFLGSTIVVTGIIAIFLRRRILR